MRAYLEKYAEPEARATLAIGDAKWNDVVAMPLYEEHEQVLACLNAIAATRQNVLVIAVVNARAASESNALCLKLLGASGHQFSLVSYSPTLTLLIVDKASRDFFPPNQGVGLARKIGCDLALRLKLENRIASHVVHTTDADARVAPDYFALVARGERRGVGKKIAAWIHPFTHDLDAEGNLPLRLYEISLRYYVLGLEWAKSPYAYHTIGSTMAIDFEAYAQVRGFPRREAAEDFYLLAKLAKVGAIQPGGGAIRLLPRPSSARALRYGAGDV